MYEIREAREEDREQSVELLVKVFKDIDSFEESWIDSWRNYMNKPENEDWNYIATHNSEVVANLAFFANNNNLIRGGQVRYGGVWAVAVDSDHRRKGLLRRIYEQTFQSMRDKNITLSILETSPYEGAQRAYERLGYEVIEKRVRHEFTPSGLRPINENESITVRKLSDEKERNLVSELERTMARFGSTAFKWPFFFVQGIKAGTFFVFERNGRPIGCVNPSIVEKGTGRELHMMNAFFSSNEVLPNILRFVVEHTSEVSKIVWNCNRSIPVRSLFQHVFSLRTTIEGAMMMRVVDFEGYCKSIKVSEDFNDEIILKIADKECPWNEGIYKIEGNDGTLTTERIVDDSAYDLTLTSNELSRIIGGIEAPSMLQKMGLIDCEASIAKKLDVLFPQDSFISHFRF
jgi:predicted acetyltransferase